MENRALAFCIILYIIIFDRIVLESLGILVSNDLFFAFYIFVYLSSQSRLYYCRSPPIGTDFWRFVLIGGFLYGRKFNIREI